MLTSGVASTVFSSIAGESLVIPVEISGDGMFSFSVFDLMKEQLHTIFWMLPMFIQAKVSLDRVDDFLRNVSGYYLPSRLFDNLPCSPDRVVGRICVCRERL